MVATAPSAFDALVARPCAAHGASAYLLFTDAAAGTISLVRRLLLRPAPLRALLSKRRGARRRRRSARAWWRSPRRSTTRSMPPTCSIASPTVTRSALHASWSVIVLRDPTARRVHGRRQRRRARRKPSRACAASSSAPGRSRCSIASSPSATWLLTTQDAATGGAHARRETRSLLGAALLRRDSVAGLLLAGTQGGSAHSHRPRPRALPRRRAARRASRSTTSRLVADLRRANELKSEFLSTMSHELRTPLNVIIGYADLLRDEAFGPRWRDQQEVIDRLRTNAALAARADQRHARGQPHRGRAHAGVQLREIDLRQLLTELQLEAEHLPHHSGVALRWEVPRTSDLVRTDPVKLKIVMRNLIGNALKFTKRGHVAVHVGYDLRGKLLDVAVRDTGPRHRCGTSAEDLRHVPPGAERRQPGRGRARPLHRQALRRAARRPRLGDQRGSARDRCSASRCRPASSRSRLSFEEHRQRRSA